ncbi:MAG: hypothetical protein AB3N16_10370 [Flavobacteriaceae bacterium]
MENNYDGPRPKVDDQDVKKSDDPKPNTSGSGGGGVIKPVPPIEKNPNR